MRSLNAVLFLTCVLSVGAQVRSEPQIFGPYTHDNLSVFLIRANGPQVAVKNGARASVAHYLTLQQAMDSAARRPGGKPHRRGAMTLLIMFGYQV